MEDDLRQLALNDGRYSPEALRFLFESLEFAIRLAGKEEAARERPESVNTFMMPAKGGYWKIKFVVDQ